MVNCLIADLAVFHLDDGLLKLIELQPGASLEEVQAKTEANFSIDERLLAGK